MKLTSIIAIIALSFQSVAFAQTANIDQEKLANLALMQQQQLQSNYAKEVVKVERLRQELEKAKGQGAQFYFKRITQVCGATAAVAAVIAVASASKRFGHLFGDSADERLGGAYVGMIVGVPAVACAGLSGLVYSLTNNKVEDLDTMVDAAELELKRMQIENESK